ncbi:FAD-binding protein [Eggerthella sinensis]|uniref:FAD-binding dehydrogenase n=1 Tax=Eggerthella sinensis TaxID=242230 RepID=A0A3N0IVC3_9ACTN|nr:FAD-binding protein [Eggerthella sinensis]RDB71817.1 FAD-binding dehydrogenase [Eggerthella sinensis]RNM40928.1 FAD-binding dehydrogenase [Eggerthella sinensis]
MKGMDHLSRRGFLTGAAATGALAAMGALAGCSPKASAEATQENGAGSAAEGAKTASVFDQPESVASQVKETKDYDVVVVGGGNSGVVGALELAQLGAKVLLVEQTTACTKYAGDIDALDSQIQKDQGIDIDKEWVIKDLVRYGQGKVDENLIRQWAYNAGAFIDWYQENMQKKGLDVMVDTVCKKFSPEGIWYSPASVHTAYQPPLKETANSMGSEIAIPAMLELYEEAGGEVMYKTTAVELVQDESGKVTGVIVEQDGAYLQLNTSKAVMLATGGFGGNKDMMDEMGVLSHKFCSCHIGAENSHGDGIRMAVWAGADRDYACEGTCNIFDRGCITGDDENGDIGLDGQGGANPKLWWPGSQPFLRLNALGKRYCNEDGPYDIAFNQACMQPGHYWWQVFDASSWEDVVSFGTTICSRVVAEEGAKNCLLLGQYYPCTNAEEWQSVFIDPNVENGVLIKADTIEELVDQMGLPKEAALASIKRYNELADKGVDEDFHKAPFRLTAVDEGPFYACKLAGWLLSTMSGVRVDYTYTPLTPEGDRIEGLKCVGLDHGGFFNGMYAQYYGGLNMSHNVVSSWLAAMDLMGKEYPVPVLSAANAYKA